MHASHRIAVRVAVKGSQCVRRATRMQEFHASDPLTAMQCVSAIHPVGINHMYDINAIVTAINNMCRGAVGRALTGVL